MVMFKLVTVQKRCLQCSWVKIRVYSSSTKNADTIDDNEVSKFASLSKEWWDETGKLRPLHTLNEMRVPLIRDGILKYAKKEIPKQKPLNGFKILDVGCGGGLLTEPLARLGSEVTGLDPAKESIAVAQLHARCDRVVSRNARYITGNVEELAEKEGSIYDGVVASEVIEHVMHPPVFVKACCDLLKPGGSIFFTTLNKTWLSWAFGVIAAEKIFKIVPDGSHEWDKFIPIENLSEMLNNNNCEVKLIHGLTMNPLTRHWSWITDTSVNYALHAVKVKEREQSETAE